MSEHVRAEPQPEIVAKPIAFKLFLAASVAFVVLLVAAATVVLPFTPWHPRMRFVDDLHSIRIGTTAEDVDRVMERWQRRVDEQWSPSSPYSRYRGPGDRMVCFGSTVAGYDADICEVIYLDGRVVNVDFLPD